jgi:hypothetical protein
MHEPVSDAPTSPKRQPPKRLRPAQIAARALNPRHRRFADFVLTGMPAGRAYERISQSRGDAADACAAEMLRRPRVRAYIGAMQDQAASAVLLNMEVLYGHALVIARGGADIGPQAQMQAIRFLDSCLQRSRVIRIEGLTLNLDADERMVAAVAFAALQAEAKGELPAEDARHLLESAALAMQVMHGKTLAADLNGGGPQLPRIMPTPAGSNGNGTQQASGNRNRATVTQASNGDVTLTSPDPTAAAPVRPKWLRSPQQIAEAARARAAKKAEAKK